MHMTSCVSAHTRRLTSLVAIYLMLAVTAAVAEPMTQRQAHAIGVDAYLYFYSLVTMDLTRKQLANVEPGKGFGGPMNTFVNVPAYPTAADRAVVRPNFDTLYSSAWLDLTREPMVVSVPDTDGRYYLLPILDMCTNTRHRPSSGWRPDLRDKFASLGWRTTGTQACLMCGSSAASRPIAQRITPRYTRYRQV
jgi:hypothetical protein